MGGNVSGIGSALGAVRSATPSGQQTTGGGGKSAPVGENNYGNSYQPVAPGGGYAAGPAGGKSSGAGQGGYGAAPEYGMPDPSTYTTSYPQQSQMGGAAMKSSGLGQGGYGMAPGFGQATTGQQPMSFDTFRQSGMMGPRTGEFRTAEQEAALDQRDYQNYLGRMGGQQLNTTAPQMDMGAAQRAMQEARGFGQQRFNPYQQPQLGLRGVQDLFNMMMGQRFAPQRQMPQYGMQPGGGFRPDMSRVQQNLGRVKPSVQKQRQDEQAARIKELEAELEGLRQPALQSYYDSGGGG